MTESEGDGVSQPTADDWNEQGHISTEYTFWCGRCSEWHKEPSWGGKARTAKLVRRFGWRLTRAYGWLCPSCAAQHKKETA